MSAIRSTGNKTEQALRKRLYAAGLRYRTYEGTLPGSPDIVFRNSRVAVFVDGDYWHGRLLIEKGWRAMNAKFRRLPASARAYWRKKLARRVLRDREVTDELRSRGWLVMRFWESEIKGDVRPAVRRILAAVRKRQQPR